MRRVLLLGLDWAKPKDPPFSLATASIVASLVRHHINVSYYTWRVNEAGFDINNVLAYIEKQQPDRHTAIAFGNYVWNDHAIQPITRILRQRGFIGDIILGGPQISYTKSGLEPLYPDVNIFVRGHGEQALVDLLHSTEPYKPITGVHYAHQLDQSRSASADLENLPSPFLENIIFPQSFIRWETQRGCPFRCSFCQYREPETLKRRHLNSQRIFEEANWITDNPVIRDIHVVDATFNSGPHYLEVLNQLSKGGFTGKIALQTRAEMIKPEFLTAIERLNQTGHVILECGIQTIHPEEQRLIERPTNLSKLKKILTETVARGIEIEVSLIFGLPNQTLDSFRRSVDFCRSIGIPVIYAHPLMLHRGTELWERQKELALVTAEEVAHIEIDRVQEYIHHVVSSPSFNYDDWKNMAQLSADLNKQNRVHVEKRDAHLQNQQTPLQRCSLFHNPLTSNPDKIDDEQKLVEAGTYALK